MDMKNIIFDDWEGIDDIWVDFRKEKIKMLKNKRQYGRHCKKGGKGMGNVEWYKKGLKTFWIGNKTTKNTSLLIC